MPALTIHRGANQIGGCCTEIAAGGERILIDLGASLPDTDPAIEDGELVSRAFAGAPPAAVLFTHYHDDHLGLHHHIPDGLPAYMGPLARELAIILAERLERSPAQGRKAVKRAHQMKKMRVLAPSRWLRLAPDLEILPLPADHSALDAYMFSIRAGGKKILFTGDFREHGIQGEGGRLWDALREQVVPQGVDVLVTEGTVLGRVREAAETPCARSGTWAAPPGSSSGSAGTTLCWCRPSIWTASCSFTTTRPRAGNLSAMRGRRR